MRIEIIEARIAIFRSVGVGTFECRFEFTGKDGSRVQMNVVGRGRDATSAK